MWEKLEIILVFCPEPELGTRLILPPSGRLETRANEERRAKTTMRQTNSPPKLKAAKERRKKTVSALSRLIAPGPPQSKVGGIGIRVRGGGEATACMCRRRSKSGEGDTIIGKEEGEGYLPHSLNGFLALCSGYGFGREQDGCY